MTEKKKTKKIFVHEKNPAAKKFSVVPSPDVRKTISKKIREYSTSAKLVPPLMLEELRRHAKKIVTDEKLPSKYLDYVIVILNNAVWRDTFAAIPYDRRIMLIPQCLRNSELCRAENDEFGLLCEQCGACPIGKLQSAAERLGYIVLVSEGTTVVTRLLESGKVDAVLGISCLSVLEKTFPHMSAEAIPGQAMPLLRDGCRDTEVDLSELMEIVTIHSPAAGAARIDPDPLREKVATWFSEDYLSKIFPVSTKTEQIAFDWMLQGGKRWRPLLTACVYKCFHPEDRPFPDALKKVAVAVECFHKASLIHDDIEDQDSFRYGKETMHEEYGIPVALNAGDLLLGEGYRFISSAGFSPEQTAEMLAIATEGHRELCLGQGEELLFLKQGRSPSSKEILDIFRGKTAPAFNVALRIGLSACGAPEPVHRTISKYSRCLGTAYQIKDDIEDFLTTGDECPTIHTLKSSLLFALGLEQSDAKTAESLKNSPNPREVQDLLYRLKTPERARQLLEHTRHEAVRSLSPLQNAHLKSLLRRMVSRVLER